METIDNIILGIGCMALGWLLNTLFKTFTQGKPEYRGQQIWEVETGLRGFCPVNAYEYCRDEGHLVAENELIASKTYYVFDIYRDAACSSFIALNRTDLAKEINAICKKEQADLAQN